jgi:hypothetical protein
MKLKRKIIILLACTLLFALFNIGAVSQNGSVSQNLEFEEKIYSEATIDQDFCDSSVLVMFDKNTGRVDKRHNAKFFGNIGIKEIIDLTQSLEKETENDLRLKNTLEAEGIDTTSSQRNMETWRQMLKLELI